MKKVLSLFIAILMILGIFVGCGSNTTLENNDGIGTETKEQVQNTDPENIVTPDNTTNVPTQVSYDSLPTGLTAVKIGSIEVSSVNTNSNTALTYRDESGKYGIMSFDGKKDTGAKYTLCSPVGDYFQVAITDTKSVTDIASLNCVGVVDASGKEIIPMKYASIDKINERYIRACEVTEQTTNKDEALVYYTEKMFSITASDDDILFKGKWYVYDMLAGKMLDGVTGTNKYSISSYGNFIKYVTDDEQQITVNHKGETLPEGADLFESGYYALIANDTGAVYDSEGKKMFDFAQDGFIPTDSLGAYYLASLYNDNGRKYVLLDSTGKTVSAEFSEWPDVYGELIYTNEQILNFAGETVIEGTYDRVYFDKQLGQAWFLKKDKEYTLIDKNGTVLFKGSEDDSTTMDPYSYFTIKKTADDGSKYYCLADKDFTLTGYSFAPWLVTVATADYTYNVVDFISGKTIISNYDSYAHVAIPGSPIYVYAQKGNRGIDIYAVK